MRRREASSAERPAAPLVRRGSGEMCIRDSYKEGVAPKLIMSGDNSTVSYNEVQVMKDYAISQGVPSHDIFCDHAGFSTYESMYRAKHVFGAERIVVATQTYHLYRALYAACLLYTSRCV